MATPVEAPKLGNTVEEVIVAKWHKRKGDAVQVGDVVLEIETDKATFDVPSPAGGTVLETFFEEGALVPVFTNLFVVGAPGEDAAAFRPSPPAPPPSSLEHPGAGSPAGEPVSERPSSPSGAMSPRARRFAEEHHFTPTNVAGSGPGGRILEEDVRRAYHTTPRPTSAARQAIQSGLQAPAEGSGAAGRILSSDLTAAAAAQITPLREKIARRMRESLASTAQYTLHASAEATGLLNLRARIKASQGALPDININDLITFCTIQALLEAPDLNAEFLDGRIRRHADVNIGFAIDTPRGLLVAVIPNAQALSVGELAKAARELTAQAQKGGVPPDRLTGATFTISNLGSLGIESFTPLLNPPQVAILGVGAIVVKPVRKQGRLEFVDAIGLSLTCDHQVIDGAPGARFLQTLRRKIEAVEQICTI